MPITRMPVWTSFFSYPNCCATLVTLEIFTLSLSIFPQARRVWRHRGQSDDRLPIPSYGERVPSVPSHQRGRGRDRREGRTAHGLTVIRQGQRGTPHQGEALVSVAGDTRTPIAGTAIALAHHRRPRLLGRGLLRSGGRRRQVGLQGHRRLLGGGKERPDGLGRGLPLCGGQPPWLGLWYGHRHRKGRTGLPPGLREIDVVAHAFLRVA